MITMMAFLISGCTIKREVKPVSNLMSDKICLIEDTKVREGFLDTYSKVLEDKGYQVDVLSPRSSKTSCKVTSTYTALWSWDLALYMSYAKIKVYENGKLKGSALYDSRSGGGRIFEKFGNGDKMIKSLVDELFPQDAKAQENKKSFK